MANKKRGRVIGINVFTDDHNRTIYRNIFNKKAYWVNDEADMKKFTVFQTRIPLAIALGIILVMFIKNIWIGIGVGAVVYIAMTIYFYTKFLPSLQQVKNFVKPDKPFTLRFVEPMSYLRIISAAILAFIAAVLIVILVQISGYQEMINYALYVLAVLSALFGIMLVMGYFQKKSLEK